MVISSQRSVSVNDSPTVSVLMSVYNEDPTLLETACASILSQSWVDFEFIVFDDGSTRQPTIESLARIERSDRRVRVFREPHRGLTRTLNIGLSHCRGEFICRQDSDDWSEPDRLATQVDFLRRNPALAVVGSWAMLHQYNRNPLWVKRLPIDAQSVALAFERMNPFCHGAICFRRTAAAMIGGYREEFTSSQDYDFLWRLCDRFGGANLPQVLYHHRFTPGSISTTRSREQARNTLLARRLASMRAGGQAENVIQALWEIERELVRDDIAAMLKQADHCLLAGHYFAALKCNLHAVLRAPWRRSPYAKACRWLAFVLAPALRPRLFGHTTA